MTLRVQSGAVAIEGAAHAELFGAVVHHGDKGVVGTGEMLAQCQEFGYVPVSMKNDWTTIYGDGVTYVGAQEELAEAA